MVALHFFRPVLALHASPAHSKSGSSACSQNSKPGWVIGKATVLLGTGLRVGAWPLHCPHF